MDEKDFFPAWGQNGSDMNADMSDHEKGHENNNPGDSESELSARDTENPEDTCCGDADCSEMDDSELQEELEKCQKESDLLRDQYARVLADLENYRRRVSRDQASWSRVAQEQVLIQLLNVMDDFERALEQGANEVSDEVRVWLSGFELTQASLLKLLQKFGVTEMTQSEHHVTFNPEYHEAIAQVDSGEYKSGSIVKVLQKGYLKDGIVMRPARVSVAK